MDNFGGHLDWDAFEYLHSNHVFIIGLPPHSSDLTQPLDLSVFGPFKKYYRRNYANVQRDTSIKVIHQRDFTNIMKDAYNEAFTSGILFII